MLIISQTTTLLQIFCELSLYSRVIFKSMRVADDPFQRNSECEWVNALMLIVAKKRYTVLVEFFRRNVDQKKNKKLSF